jgi:alginate O-acetyltransferase complex protein AlgJ
VLVFDPAPERLDPNQPPLYLKQDTHWTPAWMQEVARSLGGFIQQHVALNANGSAKPWSSVAKTVSRVGDVVDMLGLPKGQTLFAPQTVTIEEIHDAAGAVFEPQAAAEVLLLGDSFTNVFTLEQMGWGGAAGLAPQLARALSRDVDVIAQNDSGAFATRKLLWNEIVNAEVGHPDRLTGKKVVIWEFASRELAVGNWKPLDWPRRAVQGDGSGARPSEAPNNGNVPSESGSAP